jgi:hypothetical protein
VTSSDGIFEAFQAYGRFIYVTSIALVLLLGLGAALPGLAAGSTPMGFVGFYPYTGPWVLSNVAIALRRRAFRPSWRTSHPGGRRPALGG